MFERVELTNFKKFKKAEFLFRPKGLSLLAGGNNSGKSTLLQSLAVWDFCLTVLENERGHDALLPSYGGQGIGLSDDEFSPVQIPALNHLWTNLTNQVPGKDGYSLSVKPTWKNSDGNDRFVEISLALANDRLFIKASDSNLGEHEELPRVAYVPPFAGISSREQRMSVAQRRAMIGSGLVGAIIRNVLLDLEEQNASERARLKSGRAKIKSSDLKILREKDPWEILQSALGRYFQTSITMEPFNDLYHNYIRARLVKGEWDKTRIRKFPKFKPRDLMAEGSGFLQWLSVFALSLDPSVKVVLLDEPDAHLHSSMQSLLVDELRTIADSQEKQILLATHSTEILRWADHSSILGFKKNGAKYLPNDDSRIALFAGLGSDFSPRLDRLRRSNSLVIVEADSDARFLFAFSKALGEELDREIVFWPWTGSSKERRQLYRQLKVEIPGIKAVSIRDRDDLEQNQVDADTLRDKSIMIPQGEKLKLCVWQRRHIENYLLCPAAIARAANTTEAAVREHLMHEHSIVVPSNFTSKFVVQAIKDVRGKELVETLPNSICNHFGITKFDICSVMQPNEVCEDIRTFLEHLRNLRLL